VIDSWGRTFIVVKRRRSVSSRWRGQSPIDPRPSAGEPGGMGWCLSYETDNGLATAHGRDSQNGASWPLGMDTVTNTAVRNADQMRVDRWMLTSELSLTER